MNVSSMPVVVALCLVGSLAGVALVRALRRRRRPTLGAKFVTLFIGLIGADLSMLPALVVAVAGDRLFGLRTSGVDGWIVIAGYAVVTLYVIVRLFPWSEVEALTADPDASLRDVVARIMAKSGEPAADDDERGSP